MYTTNSASNVNEGTGALSPSRDKEGKHRRNKVERRQIKKSPVPGETDFPPVSPTPVDAQDNTPNVGNDQI